MESNINTTTSLITWANRRDHFLARWHFHRMGHLVIPGLYALGNPTKASPVFVTANYTLSFDALRSALAGKDGYILVLNTQAVNVWCAAGKGTFGTDELVHRITTTHLADVVNHRTLLLPQLGAPGVAAHEVYQSTGFKVEYGPVRAADLPEYLETHEATPEMRQVHFDLRDRVTLIPVEIVAAFLPTLVIAMFLLFYKGLWEMLPVILAVFAGTVLFPIFLPWLPTRDFVTKGFILGAISALIYFLIYASLRGLVFSPRRVADAIIFIMVWSPVTAFVSLNFTGSTTFTSRSGVRREMFRYLRVMATIFVIGIIANVVMGRMG